MGDTEGIMLFSEQFFFATCSKESRNTIFIMWINAKFLLATDNSFCNITF